MPQSQLAMGPKPFAQCWKEAAVSHNPALTQWYYQVSFAQLDLGMVLSPSEKPTQEVCKNGAGGRRLGPLCLHCLVRSCYLNSLFHLEAVGWRAWTEATGLMPPICGPLLIQGASNKPLCEDFASLTTFLLKSYIGNFSSLCKRK